MRRLRTVMLAISLPLVAGASLANPVAVQPGDNLWDLARRYDTTVEALMQANNLVSSDLFPGDLLRLPESESNDTTTPSQGNDTTTQLQDQETSMWTVAPGDTLWDIARSQDTTVEALMRANALTSARLTPGDVLVLPGRASGDATPEPQGPATWTVAPGDTLWDIAIATSRTVEELSFWNGLRGNLIRPGDTLRLTAPDALALQTDAFWLEVTIRPGDSLWRIGRAYDVTPAAIAAASGIDVNAILRPGETLTIPGVYAGNVQASGDVGGYTTPTITVAPGDTLWDIARRYDTTVATLMRVNALSHNRLSIGQRLRLVASEGEPVLAAATPAPTIASDAMVWPLRGAITSRFGWRSLTIGGTNMHYGLDIDGHTGDPIVSATAGTVVFSGWSGGYGQVVIVESGSHEYYYAHCSELLVSVGDRVAPGDLIGRVGATGRVTGSHLHFEVRIDGNPVDPLPMLEARAGAR